MRAPQQGSSLQMPAPVAPRRPPDFGAKQEDRRLVLMYCIAFFSGYLPGILLWRAVKPAYGAELIAWYTDPARYAHWSGTWGTLACGTFLQLSCLLLWGFCVFGLFFLLLQFCLRGIWLGFCAAGVFRLYGAGALLRYRLLDSPADLILLFSCLCLAVHSAKSAGLLYGTVFMPPGWHASKMTPHRVFTRYLFVLLFAEAACCICAGFSVLLAGILY